MLSNIEDLIKAQEGWFWKAKRGYWHTLHLPGPIEGWSLCGAARLGHPANHIWQGERQPQFGYKCLNCKRLADG